MKHYFSYILIIAFSLILANGCFPSQELFVTEPHIFSSDHLTGEFIKTPVKLILKDSSVVIFESGFNFGEKTVHGSGIQYRIVGSSDEQELTIPFDQIATMAYYNDEFKSSMIWGSIIMAVTGPLLLHASIDCLMNPKSCFGSCPTVYTRSNDSYLLEAELFSYSLSRFYQETDYDRLGIVQTPNMPYTLRITNEALETHYINEFNLIGIYHPAGTEAYPTPNGEIVLVEELRIPARAVDSHGEDILPLIQYRDELSHRGDTTRLNDYQTTSDNDWLELSLQVPEGRDSVSLVLRVRNTLLTTALFYDVVLASQGVKAMEWTERLNTDSLYATMYRIMYNQFAGITVKVKSGDQWIQTGRFGDVGPIAWKDLGLLLPVHADSNGIMQIRLEWFPDNFMFDFIGYDTKSHGTETSLASMETIPPTSITNYLGEDVSHFREKIRQNDDAFLITQPGDHYYFEYEIPDNPGLSTTLMLKSIGYYTEWLRGDWIASPGSDYQFNLFAMDETLEQLKKSWSENRNLLEKKFFETKIPLRERK